MTRWLDPIKEAQANLIAENNRLREERDKLREVNRAQADNYDRLAEQCRRAQERLRTCRVDTLEEAARAIEVIVKAQLDISENHEAGLIPMGCRATMLQMPHALRALKEQPK